MKIVLVVAVLGLLGLAGFYFARNREMVLVGSGQGSTGVSWSYDFNGGGWRVSGEPPACPEPLVVDSPVDLSLVSGILYPGQVRGSDYKPHGGFRFDNRDDNVVEVRAVMDGYVLKAAKYDDGYAVQISIFFVNDCGVMVMHDHILTPSPKLEQVLRDVPVGEDSRTMFVEPRVYFAAGEVLATKIGYEDFPGGHNGRNVFVDFGLYDLRQTNGVVYDEAFRAEHSNINEYGTHGLCWFDNLAEDESRVVRGLPAGGREGKVSDYCN